MPSPETTILEQIDARQEAEVQARRRIDLHRIAGVCAVGLALAVTGGGGSESADAHESVAETLPSIERTAGFAKSEERKAERSVKRMILANKKPPVYNGSVDWETTDKKGVEFGYRTKRPIVAKVRRKDGKRVDRYFEVQQGIAKKSEITVSAIDPYARKVNQKSNTTDLLDGKISRYSVKFNKDYVPIIRQTVPGQKGKVRSVALGETTLRQDMEDVDSLSEGKRFTKQVETLKWLRRVENLQEYKTVMQGYLSQYNVKLNIAPEEVVQRPGSYTVEHLTEGDLPAAKRFGFVIIDELSKYPKGFLQQIGMRQMDLVGGVHDDGYKFGGVANINDSRVILSANNKSEGLVMHHETAHFMILNILHKYIDEQTWMSFNPPGFNYRLGRGLCRESDIACNQGLGKSTWPGFVSEYSELNIGEDQAETFALIMCNSFDGLKEIARKEPLLGQKVNYLISVMRQVFPFFNERYLDEVNPGQSC